jgi:hypothetical protein
MFLLKGRWRTALWRPPRTIENESLQFRSPVSRFQNLAYGSGRGHFPMEYSMNRILFTALLSLSSAVFANQNVLASFDSWAEQFLSQRASADLGGQLAQNRRSALIQLMSENPTEALKYLHSTTGLPANVTAHMETQMDDMADYEVKCAYGQPLTYELRFQNGQRFQLVPQKNLAKETKLNLRVKGFALGNQFVVTQATQIVTRNGSGPQASPFTIGNKKVLFIRIDFSDAPGDPLSTTSATNLLNTVDTFWRETSYGKTSATGTVVPMTVRVPGTKASYGMNNDTTKLLNDGRNAARNAGYDPGNYDFDIVAFKQIQQFSWAGLGMVGGKGTWINGDFTLRVLGHELGHNLGLHHANFWVAPNETIIGNGSSQEYGNPFDIMGGGSGEHYNSWYKTNLDWFITNEWSVVNASGNFRIADLNQSSLGAVHALKVPIGAGRDYWVEFRPAVGGLAARAAMIFWGYASSSEESNLLDMTPSTGTASDAPLAIGRTFADEGNQIYITPTGLPATNPPSLDVVVNRGPFAGNVAPVVTLTASTLTASVNQAVTFTAAATDADGDPLAYYWDFGDTFVSTNTNVQMRSFTAARDVLAQVTVSDMKGHTARASVVVRVGTVTTPRLTGRVTENGTGVEGVRVINSSNKVTFTNSDGTYALVGLFAGPTTVSATKAGYNITAAFGNPVNVPAGGVANIDFTASRVVYGISGRVTATGVGLPGITIQAGTYSAQTNASGDYVLSVPNGSYNLVALGVAGQTFRINGAWTNPVQINGMGTTGKNFAEEVVPVSGEVTGQPGPHSVSNGVTTVNTVLGAGNKWLFTFPRVQPGTYNLSASATGQNIVPMFVNPITVAAGPVNGLVFNSSIGNVSPVSGKVEQLGAGLANLNVELRDMANTAVLFTSKTDSRGRFVFPSVIDGSFVVQPVSGGETFAPPNRAITVAGMPISMQDFVVTNANAPPTIAIRPTATPFPVTGTTANLFVLGEDAAPGSESDLKYTWSQLFGPATVALMPNGTNASKSINLTFTASGAYGFRVVVKDIGNATASADITVVVPPTPTSVVLTPAMDTLDVGNSKQFVAAVADQFGTSLNASDEVTWAVVGTCGTITPTGKFTATTVGMCSVTATVGSITGSANITARVGLIPRIVSGPTVTPNPVVGAKAKGEVTAADNNGEAALVYTWSAMDPPGTISFVPNANNAAKNTVITFGAVGKYNLSVEVKDADDNLTVEFISVNVTDGLAQVILTPSNNAVAPGQTVTIAASGKSFSGGSAPIPSCAFVSSGGSIDANGVLTAPSSAGMLTVTAVCGDFTAGTSVNVINDAMGGGAGGGGTTGKGCSCSTDSSAGLLALVLLSVLRRKPQFLA